MADTGPAPVCCKGDCCGAGSYCCAHPENSHTHLDEHGLSDADIAALIADARELADALADSVSVRAELEKQVRIKQDVIDTLVGLITRRSGRCDNKPRAE